MDTGEPPLVHPPGRDARKGSASHCFQPCYEAAALRGEHSRAAALLDLGLLPEEPLSARSAGSGTARAATSIFIEEIDTKEGFHPCAGCSPLLNDSNRTPPFQ